MRRMVILILGETYHYLCKGIHHPTMSSSEITNIEREAVQLQINLYKQMREQLLAKIKLYQLQHKAELATIISESI
jgi:hypothetical protein